MHQDRLQRERRAERVREHKAANMAQGVRCREEIMTALSERSKADLERKRMGARNQRKLGYELTQRVIESRHALEGKHAKDASELRQVETERLRTAYEARAAALEEKREKVAKMRSEEGKSLPTARYECYWRRKQTADDVRLSVGNWRVETEENAAEFADRAKSNRELAISNFKGAVEGQVRDSQRESRTRTHTSSSPSALLTISSLLTLAGESAQAARGRRGGEALQLTPALYRARAPSRGAAGRAPSEPSGANVGAIRRRGRVRLRDSIGV